MLMELRHSQLAPSLELSPFSTCSEEHNAIDELDRYLKTKIDGNSSRFNKLWALPL
jgi:hypothetical protein